MNLMNPAKAAPMTKESNAACTTCRGQQIIHNKATNATNNKLKEQAWQSLTNEFNSSVTSFPITASQLRLKWENLKKSVRNRSAHLRSNINKTGGGKDSFPPDEILDKVASLLGSTCEGFSVEYGGNSIMKSNMDVVTGEISNIEGEVITFINGEGHSDGVCGRGAGEEEVLTEVEIVEIPSSKQKPFFSTEQVEVVL